MRQLNRLLGVGTCVLLASLAVGARAEDDISSDCAVCHEDIVAQFETTAHSISGRGVPSCATCHTNGQMHMEEGGDPSWIEIPAGADGEQLCIECHQQIHTMFSSRSAHSDTAIYCGSCHSIHGDDCDNHFLLADQPNPLCATCHLAQGNSFRRPYGHRLDRGGLQCVSCHNPHGGPARLTAEKRGPFAFPHVTGIAGDCMSCHQPHGSSNPMALTRSRVDQLCLECHSRVGGTDTFGSQTPSSHDLFSPRYRNCTVCHVAIHGSNLSPALLK